MHCLRPRTDSFGISDPSLSQPHSSALLPRLSPSIPVVRKIVCVSAGRVERELAGGSWPWNSSSYSMTLPLQHETRAGSKTSSRQPALHTLSCSAMRQAERQRKEDRASRPVRRIQCGPRPYCTRVVPVRSLGSVLVAPQVHDSPPFHIERTKYPPKP